MKPSRRKFLEQSLVTIGACALAPFGCRWAGIDTAAPPATDRKRASSFEPAYLELERGGELARREERLWELMKSCRCCPRECGVDRIAGETGVCSSTAELKVYSAGPHFGEESPLVGRRGSGTIFFSNCNLLCCYCQNWEINHRGDGQYRNHEDLAVMMLSLQERGCHNINLVTPTHFVPHIVKAVRLAAAEGLRLPLVYNTSGYDNLEVVKLLDGIVDIYLPDFKYQDGKLAAKYSNRAADYPEVAAAVIKEMHRQVGRLEVDEAGVAVRGLIVRHLVLPHNIAGTDRFVRWVAKELSADTYVNIMPQYRPEHRAFDYPKIARRLTSEEWQQAMAWAREAGLTNLDA
ncbi:MAG: radical SAM protein [Acidobacteriota bacterium]|nr:MAG: radical SAM protein [Acidobacteriota bacterium]